MSQERFMNEKTEERTIISFKKTVEELEKRLILDALEYTGWIQAKAAKRLDISQRILGYKMKKYGIRNRTTKT
jgi:transcriptional regulator with GAF, ATPase, and Fis domain